MNIGVFETGKNEGCAKIRKTMDISLTGRLRKVFTQPQN
jgi:hypothetical protein